MQFDFSKLLKASDIVETRSTGETIFEMGEPGQVLYVIKSGKAQIKVGELVLRTIAEGDILGEMAVLDDEVHTRSATAVALSNCEFVPVDRDRLLAMISTEPLLALELAKLMVDRLRTTTILTYHDVLTGLPNRVLFQDSCRAAIARANRRGAVVGVLHIDLDNFGRINDSYGFAAGDLLLCEVANRLRERLHVLDVLARLGADKFAVFLEDITGSNEVAATAQNVLNAFASPIAVNGRDVYISASIGASCYPLDGDDAIALMGNAEIAAGNAKGAGGNGYGFYAKELHALAVETLNLQNHLRRAVDRNEFLLYYQPRVEVRSGKITSVEALIRWNHPELGIVPPGKFIPIAEKSGMIELIGDWVLRTACAQQKAWLMEGLAPSRIAVNLSVRQLRQPDLKQRIALVLEEVGLETDRLELEITESVVMEDPVRTVLLLRELRTMGIEIALDDFGTEYSSLGYLKKFPLDIMKIDQSFVRDLPLQDDDVAIVKAIITLGKNLHLKIVAEGVETEEQLALLTNLGCDEIQGYLFSRPLSADECKVLLKERSISSVQGLHWRG